MPEHVIIIGSGPAGHTAAVYTARANLKPVMFEGYATGGIPGGQLMTTTEGENYPGFPEGIQGPELMEALRKQSLRFGTRIFTEDVTKVDLSKRPFTVSSAEQSLTTQALIIATGATAKRLNLPGEQKLWTRGMSACAVCDVALPIFRNKVLVVVGGGDSAAEESTFLTKFASKVYLVHRREALRASKIMQERVLNNKKVEVLWNTAEVDVPGVQSFCSPGRLRRFAVAPVAMMSACVVSDCSAEDTVNGRLDRSTFVTSSVKTRVPKRSDCLRSASINSGP